MTDELKEANTTETADSPMEASSAAKLSETGKLALQGVSSEQVASDKEDPSQVADWIDRGVVDVPVDDLPWPEKINGPEDFDHNISYDDAMSATKRFQEMRPLINKGYKGDDFSGMDQAQGLDYANGHRRVYDLFFGSSPIKVDKVGNQYDIVGGRHRVYVAKELGLSTIPARVKEKVN